jgi:cellulose synthase (UDP-forming)
MLQPWLDFEPRIEPKTAQPVGSMAIEPLMPAQKVVVFVFLAVAVQYLSWRAGTLNPGAPIFSWLVFAAELVGFASVLGNVIVSWGLTVRLAPAPLPGLNVDVFIPTRDEPVEMLRRTLLAAGNLDYPHTTWLLDEGNRPEIARLAMEMGAEYLAPAEADSDRAGNLNHALRHASGEFIAIFDAGHAPKRSFLSETLGFMRNADTAFVQTPQDFYNLDSYQHRHAKGGPVWTERSLFFRVIQRGKDRWNAALYCGSCVLVRRAAVDRIGGFQPGPHTGNLATSVAFHRAGFQSVYLPEPLAFGVAPDAASSFLRQRLHAGQEAMQMLRQQGFFLRGKLSFAQRLSYLGSALGYFDGWQKAAIYLAPVWILMTGTLPIDAPMSAFLPLFIPYLVLALVVSEEVGRGYAGTLMVQQYRTARFTTFAAATLSLLGRRMTYPKSSPDSRAEADDESWTMAPLAAISFINLFAVLFAILIWPAFAHLPGPALLAAVIWACINSGLAYAVVRFSQARSGWRRQEYRFPIALPVRARVGGNPMAVMTVQDISSSGCRIAGLLSAPVAAGDGVVGTLELPDGPLRFRARVVALIPAAEEASSDRPQTLGLSFEGITVAFRDRLDLFLYGSDLQWQLRGMTERGQTPTETLFRDTTDIDKRRRALSAWTTAELTSDPSLAPILISEPLDAEARRVVASYRRLDGAPSLRMRSHGGAGAFLLDLRPLAQVGRVNTPAGDIFLTEMVPC